ncbi:hypothetical protein [Actinoplanes utahensis]|uniref:hypothetical protein n=1 Tax=Actinoplanes utahensis TaxID=1869 RepID=UPI001269CD4D|nr:hypothetical protein [Actinoplanes utahensis]GIF30751.1 hypothetical protein Aut01nite_37370 [Actinoplanes utahensis]
MSAAVRHALESFGARVSHARWTAAQVMSELRQPEQEGGLDHDPDPRVENVEDVDDLHRHFPRP